MMSMLNLRSDRNIIYLLVIMAAILLLQGMFNAGAFFSVSNFQSMTSQMPLLGMLALAMSVCMLTGGINLSIIATTNACGLVMASVMAMSPGDGAMLLPALLAGLVTAVIIGLINGFLIAFVGVSPILATLGMMTLILSLIHISEPTRQAEISYAVFCLKKKKKKTNSETVSYTNQTNS